MRQLGLGYANLGALLMAHSLLYDSHEGRTVAAAITALMTGQAYRTSGEIAAAIGPYDEFERNREPHLNVMRKHRDAAYAIEGEVENRPARSSPPELGRGGQARRAARPPQCSGHRLGPDRDHFFPDGLRHHRRPSPTSRW